MSAISIQKTLKEITGIPDVNVELDTKHKTIKMMFHATDAITGPQMYPYWIGVWVHDEKKFRYKFCEQFICFWRSYGVMNADAICTLSKYFEEISKKFT